MNRGVRATRLPVLLAANALAVVALLWVSGTIPPVTRDGPRMLLIAHRGDTSEHPENSLGAILAARDGTADGIEFDVQRSADGTWWVFHDLTIDRLTDASGAFAGLRDKRIAALLLSGTDERPPRLADVVDALQSYDGWIYLDIKEVHARAAVGAVEQAERIHHLRVIVQSVEVAAAIRRSHPQIETLALSNVTGQDTSPFITAWLANQIEVTRPDIVSGKQRPVDAFIDLGAPDVRTILDRLSRFGVRATIAGVPR